MDNERFRLVKLADERYTLAVSEVKKWIFQVPPNKKGAHIICAFQITRISGAATFSNATDTIIVLDGVPAPIMTDSTALSSYGIGDWNAGPGNEVPWPARSLVELTITNESGAATLPVRIRVWAYQPVEVVGFATQPVESSGDGGSPSGK